MRVKPEDELIQQRVGPVDEEVGAQLSIHEHHRQHPGEEGAGKQHQPGGDLHRPDEERQPEPGHPGRPHVVDRHQEIDRAHDRGDAQDVQPQDPQVLAETRGVGLFGQRHISRPARRRRSGLGQQTAVHHEPAERNHPEGEGVDPGKRHVTRPDHQRHEVVAETGEDRDDPEEDHGRPVQRHDLVVGLRRQEVVVSYRQLGAHQEGHDAAHQEEEEGGVEIEDPDLLMVDRRQPFDDGAPPGSLPRERDASHV